MSENMQSTKDEVQDFAKFVFTTTTPDEVGLEDCVFVFDERRAVTFRHGDHEELFSEVGAEITIYPARSREDASAVAPVQMKVEYFNPHFNYVVLQTKDGEPTFRNNRPKGPVFPHVGLNYTMIGIGRDGVFVKRNTILSRFRENSIGFMVGGSIGEDNDLGAGLISNGHFLGLVIARLKCDSADNNSKEGHDHDDATMSDHPVPHTCFVSGILMLDFLRSFEPLLEECVFDEEQEEASTSGKHSTDTSTNQDL